MTDFLVNLLFAACGLAGLYYGAELLVQQSSEHKCSGQQGAEHKCTGHADGKSCQGHANGHCGNHGEAKSCNNHNATKQDDAAKKVSSSK